MNTIHLDTCTFLYACVHAYSYCYTYAFTYTYTYTHSYADSNADAYQEGYVHLNIYTDMNIYFTFTCHMNIHIRKAYT